MNYEAVIGLEVHAHLKTKSKAFCGCSTEFGSAPNSQTCPVCLGFPGSLPVLNETVLRYAIKAGLALNCQVQGFTKFDRKHYYYPDLPKNYQISQYDLPVSIDGFLDIFIDGLAKRIRIKRAHLEEDAGKLIHTQNSSLVDYNRAGMPLLEIVSEPDINSPLEAYEYLASLKSILEYIEVSDCDMEKGSLRCDANISIRPKGGQGLGAKVELKNMNSFKGVKDALSHEIERQIESVNNGEKIIQETRLWDARSGQTIIMRTKEEAKDYRYFPEPDLTPFTINKDKIEEIKKQIPELPREKMLRFIKEYSISEYNAKILVSNKKDAIFSEGLIKEYPGLDKRPLVNWLVGPLAAIAREKNCSISDLEVPGGSGELIKLVRIVEEEKISNLTAKAVLNESVLCGATASRIIKEKNLFQVSDQDSLNKIVEEVINENPKSVASFKEGKENAVMFLVGQAMKKSQGKANPKMLQEILRGRLK